MRFRSPIAFLLLIAVSCTIFTACKTDAAPVKEIDLAALQTEMTALKANDGTALYQNAQTLKPDELMNLYEIDTSLLKNYLILFDQDYNFFMALEPLEDKNNDVKNNISAALVSLETQLELYAPEQNARVKDRLETVRGNYLIYIASADNNAVIDAADKYLEH